MKKTNIITKITSLALSLIITAGGLLSCANPAEYRPRNDENENQTDTASTGGYENSTGLTYDMKEQLLDKNFVMQEPTDKLVLYVYSRNNGWVKPAVEVFKELYPEVNVIVHKFEDNKNYELLMKHKLPKGMGPDLVVGQFTDVGDDYYQYLDNGVFVDLNQFILRDEDFSFDGYNENVMDAGVYKGKRLVVPIEYEILPLITSEEILAGEGLTEDDIASFSSLITSAHDYNLKYKASVDKSAFSITGDTSYILRELLQYGNVSIIDYENKDVAIDGDSLRTVIDYIKDAPRSDDLDFNNAFSNGIRAGTTLVDNTCYKIDLMLFYELNWIRHDDMTPITEILPAADGGVCAIANGAAIPRRSKNQVNAYRFLKVLLSEEVQVMEDTGRYVARSGLPVLESTARYRVADDAVDSVKYNGMQVDEDEAQRLADMAVDIDCATLGLPPAVSRIITEEMTPYIEGEDSYESCCANLVAALEDYLR